MGFKGGSDDLNKLNVTNDLTVAGDIILDDGGSIKEAGGTAAITIDASGNVTKIGQDTHTTGQFLKFDGAKFVLDAASGGGGGASALDDLSDASFSSGDLTITSLDTLTTSDTAHNVAGRAVLIRAGNTTAGTTNNIAGGDLTLAAGQGKGSGAGGDIVFKTANAGTSGNSLNSLATALTISDDLSSTFAGNATFGVDDTGVDVRIFSATTNEGVLYDASEDELGLLLTTKLSFHDIGGGENIHASSNGHLEINAGTTLDATAPTIDLNASTAVTIDGPALTVADSADGKPVLTLKTTHTTKTSSSELQFLKDAADTEDGEVLGQITFFGEDEGNNNTQFAGIVASISESDDSDEAGVLELQVAESDGTTTAMTTGLKLEGEHATDGEVDVTIGAGTASTTTIVGTSQFNGDATFGVDDTGVDVRIFSATTNEGVLYDASEDELALLLTTKLKFHDVGGGEEIFASGDGHLEINAGTTLDATAPTIDLNASTAVTITTPALSIDSGTASKPVVEIKNTNNDANGSILLFTKDGANAADGDVIGSIVFASENDAGSPESIDYAVIKADIPDVSDSAEEGRLTFSVASHDGDLQPGLIITSGDQNDEVDVTIGGGGGTVSINGGFGGRRVLDLNNADISGDGTGSGDMLMTIGSNTASLTPGKIYYYKSDGTWAETDANASGTSTGLLAVKLAAALGGGMLTRGFVQLATIDGTEAVGGALYLSETAGAADATAPSSSGDIVRLIGYALHASSRLVYFDPDKTFVEIT